ncbi:DivIVA domain-containing protein [Streptomyces sp. WAC05292]|nr:DivIVA domain-containing protein [Streptomyces sp. WAC05292]
MIVFWFLLIALVVVVTAVTLAVIGGGSEAVLPDAEPDRVADALPETRPVAPADVAALRLPVAARGYRMAEVDDVLERLAAELAERDSRIAELAAAVATAGRPAAAGSAPAAGAAAPGGDAPGEAEAGEPEQDHEPTAVDLSKDSR